MINSYANSLNTQINNLQFVSAISQDADSSAILNQLNNAAAYAAIAEGLTGELDSSVVNINNITNELRAINNSVVNTVPAQYAVNRQSVAIAAFNSIRSYVDNGASLVTSTTIAYNTLKDIVRNYYSKLAAIQQNVETATAIQSIETSMTPNEIRRRKSSVNGRDYIDKIPLVGTLQLPYQPLIENSHDVATVAEINAILPPNQQKKF